MKRIRMKVAIAAPSPKRFWPLNATCHWTKARVAASSWVEPGAIERIRSKSLSTPMICVTKTTVSTGASSGIVIRRKTCHSLAPSVRAASRVSRGIEARPAAVITIAKPAWAQMNAIMIAGVISLSPSQLTPPNGSANVVLATLTWYWPSSTSSKAKVPFVSVFVSSTVSP